VKKPGQYVLRKVPIDILFSETHPLSVDERDSSFQWSDVPLVNLVPHMQATRYIVTKTGSIQPYINYLVNTGQSIDLQRVENELRRKLTGITRYFDSDLPVVARHERDRLILDSGNLRCCEAKVRSKEWISVRMPLDVAKTWDTRSTAELEAVLRKQGRNQFYTPVLHENYRKAKVSRKGVRRLDMIREFIGPTHKQLSVLDIGCNTGFYSFHLFRQGFKVTAIDVDEGHFEVAQALQQMYGTNVEFKLTPMQELGVTNRFDIALGMSVFWHLLGWGAYPQSITPKQLGNTLDRLVEHALFWEGGKRCADEIAIIKKHSGLSHYTHLGTTHATGIENREFGVFTRQPPDICQELFRDSKLR
jgi:hypothetical protein